jgi:energy-converting hydrogenase Eha subunit C
LIIVDCMQAVVRQTSVNEMIVVDKVPEGLMGVLSFANLADIQMRKDAVDGVVRVVLVVDIFCPFSLYFLDASENAVRDGRIQKDW